MDDRPRPEIGTRAVAQRLRDVVEQVAARTALSDLEQRTTYADVARRVAATALRLTEDVGATGPVLVAGDTLASFATGILAAATAGRASVVLPAGLMSPAIDRVADRTGAAVLVGESNEERRRATPCLVEPVITLDPTLDPIAALESAIATTEDWSEVVTLSSTSGSTGDPKLIVQRSPMAWGRTLPGLDQLETGTRLASNLPVSPAFRHRLGLALLSGSAFVGFPLDRFSPSELLRRLAEEGVTELSVTPSILRRLHLAAGGRPALAGIRSVSSVGEPLHWADVVRARELCGPQVTVINRYASTEAGIVSARTIGPDEPVTDGPVDVGRPHPGRSVWIEAADGDAAKVGTVGRIVIEGPFTTEGMPLEDLGGGHSRFRSGDLGRLDERGSLWLHGRDDRMVKVAGMRVEPAAVEDVLRHVPGVLDAAVLPVPIAEAEVRLVAHVVVDDDGPDLATLRHAVGEQVTAIAVPVRFHLRRDPLPLLPTGKVDRQTLLGSDPS